MDTRTCNYHFRLAIESAIPKKSASPSSPPAKKDSLGAIFGLGVMPKTHSSVLAQIPKVEARTNELNKKEGGERGHGRTGETQQTTAVWAGETPPSRDGHTPPSLFSK